MRFHLLLISLGLCFNALGQGDDFNIKGRLVIEGAYSQFNIVGNIRIKNVSKRKERFKDKPPHEFGSDDGIKINSKPGDVTIEFKIESPGDMLLVDWDANQAIESNQLWELHAIMQRKIENEINKPDANQEAITTAYDKFKAMVSINPGQTTALQQIYLSFGGARKNPLDALNVYIDMLNNIGPKLSYDARATVFARVMAQFVKRAKVTDTRLACEKIFADPYALPKWKSLMACYKKVFEADLREAADLGETKTSADLFRQWNVITSYNPQ